MTEQDPGVGGDKLSKSDSGAALEARNKSYNKVLDAEIAWIRAEREGLSDAEDLRIRWQKKAEWHEKEFGW
jgi:hypothetical protein